MSIVDNQEIRVLIAPSKIFNQDIETEKVELTNHQVSYFILSCGEGAAKKLTVQLIATNEENSSEKIIAESEITIGENSVERFVIDADYIAHDDFDRVYLKAQNANEAEIIGTIFAILTNERYRN